jgi:hypothetical protein
MAANDVRLAGDELANGAFMGFGSGFGRADFYDCAAELVSDNSGWMNPFGRPLVPVVNVEIRSADAGGLEFDFYMTGSTSWLRNIDDLYARAWLHLGDGSH